MSRPPKIMFNADFLVGVNEKIGDRLTPLCLSPSSFAMLTQMNEMVLWDTRWEGEPENIEAIRYLAWRDLNIPRVCESAEPTEPPEVIEPPEVWVTYPPIELVWCWEENAKLRKRIALLEQKMCNYGCGCGNGGGTANPNAELFTEAQLGQLAELFQSVRCDDVGTIDAEKCTLSNWIIDSWVRFIDEIFEYYEQNSLTRMTLLELIKSFAWIGGQMSGVYMLVTTVLDWISTGSLTAVRNWILSNRAELVGIIYSSTSPAGAKDGAMTYISSSRLAGGSKAILWAMMRAADWNAIFDGTVTPPAGYEGETACTDIDLSVPAGFSLVPWTVAGVGGGHNDAVSTFSDNVAMVALDQRQTGAYLDAEVWVAFDVNEFNPEPVAGFMLIAENWQANSQDGQLVLGNEVDSLHKTDGSLAGLSGTVVFKGSADSEGQELIDWRGDVPADFQRAAYDEQDNRFYITNLDQTKDCQVTFKLTCYAVIPV